MISFEGRLIDKVYNTYMFRVKIQRENDNQFFHIKG